MYTVDVVIPTYKPTKQFETLITKLEEQSLPIHKIILMNTEEKYFEQLFYGTGFLEKYQNIEVHHLSCKEFDHGRTRDRGIQYSTADIVICMTHDAVPANQFLVEKLVKALEQKDVVAAYARQLPNRGCDITERYTRHFNYPASSRVKTMNDVEELGIKTFFCSNVCAAYWKKVYDRLGGFTRKTIFNEDMIYAAKAVKAGYGIAYAADAKVIHSHNYTCMQQLKRNFDLGVSQADHPEVFEGISSTGEGIKLVKKTITFLKSKGLYRKIPGLIVKSGFKYIGFWLGKHYKKLSRRMILRCTMNQNYWENNTL